MLAMYSVLVTGSAFTIWVLGYSEKAVGMPLDNLLLSAMVSVPVAMLGAVGFGLIWRRISNAPTAFVAVSGTVSAVLVYVWSMIEPIIPSVTVNLLAFAGYCVGLGVVSGLVLCRTCSRASLGKDTPGSSDI